MKITFIKSIFTALIILFGSIYLLFFFIPKKFEENANSGVSKGEIWMYSSGKENPFEKEEVRCYKVLDVKNGHVKYLHLPSGHINSSSIRLFKFKSKKIK